MWNRITNRKANNTYIIGDIRLLRLAEERDARIGFRGQHIDQGVGVTVQRNRGGRLQKLAIDCAENTDVVIGAGGGTDDAVVLVDHLHELADDEGNGLDPLNLLLGTEELALQVLLFVLHVLLLDVDELQLPIQGLEAAVEIVLGGGECLRFRQLRDGRRWLRRHHHRC